jgi:YegS/Rv2252/BmrU family lipid kinase
VSRRLQLIVNPTAGRGRARTLLPSVEAALRSAGHDLVVTPTRSLEHADELVAAALAADRVAVAMGGDGIVGRVAGGVAAAGGLMGVLPGGRGNDFCRAAGIPLKAVEACDLLTTGQERRIDLGYVGDTAFVGIASIGFDSAVQERVLTSRIPLGDLVYLFGSLTTVASWRPATFRLRVDGEPADLVGWSVAVSNSGMYGGGMRLAPDASLEDGLLDVVMTSTTNRRTFLRALPKVFKGTHVDEPSVTVRTARTVELVATEPAYRVFADGDPIGAPPCTVTVRPAALRVLLPAII